MHVVRNEGKNFYTVLILGDDMAKKTTITITTLLLTISAYSYANSTGGISDSLYYRIGGGSVKGSTYTFDKPKSIINMGKWNSSLMCGNFDISSTISNQLNGVTDGFNNIMSEVINNAKGAVASLPALIIQRSNPQLYDLLTNGVLQAKLDYSDIKTSCKQLAEKMTDYSDSASLVQSAKVENMAEMLNGKKVDAIRVDKQIDNEAGKNGISWIGGSKRGGKGQHPINITSDVALAGYNSLINRTVTDTTPVSNAQDKGGVYRTWNKPSDAQVWLTDVIGERTMITDSENKNDNDIGKPGTGLNPKTQEYYELYYKKLVDLVNGTKPINKAELESLEGSSVNVTRSVIETLREDNERVVLVSRLASEMALSRTIEEAMMARRIILAGRKEPNIAKNEQAQSKIIDQIDELDMELNQIKLEYDMRKSIAGNTLLVIQERKLQRQQGIIFPIDSHESFDANK